MALSFRIPALLFAIGLACLTCPAWPQAATPQPPAATPGQAGQATVAMATVYQIIVATEAAAEQLRADITAVPAGEQRLAKFMEAARSSSIDANSAPQGGRIGYAIFKGEAPPQLDAAVFGTPAGELAAPFHSTVGWHLVFVPHFDIEPVDALCRPATQAAYLQASGAEKLALALALAPVNRTTLPATVEPLIGAGWHGPLADGGGNLMYLKPAEIGTGAAPDAPRILVQHLDLMAGRPVAKRRPVACVASARQEWEVDCQRNTVGKRTFSGYEGRGALGRRLVVQTVPDAEFVAEPIQPGTMAAQFQALACGK